MGGPVSDINRPFRIKSVLLGLLCMRIDNNPEITPRKNISSLVAHHLHPLDLELRRPVRMSKHPILDRRPRMLVVGNIRSKRRLDRAVFVLGTSRLVDQGGVVRHDEDLGLRFFAPDGG